jgi:NADH:ubiquinone oxidoreductase subunit 6 (subunit J)
VLNYFTLLSQRSLSARNHPTASHKFFTRAFLIALHVALAVLTVYVLPRIISIISFHALLLLTAKYSLVFDLVLPFLACILAICVPLLSNPMHALLSLVGVFLATILFYVKSGIEFIGLVTLIVYVGAVAILFLFVIMLLNVKSLTMNTVLIKYYLQYMLLLYGVFLAGYLLNNLVFPLSFSSLDIVDFPIPAYSPGYFFEDVYYAVLYRAADVNAIAGLYTTHAVLF